MSIETLTIVVSPPAAPVQTGSPAEWDAVCKTIGVALPEDLRSFAGTYGSGMFWLNPSVGVDNPFGPNYVEDLVSISKAFTEVREQDGIKQYPYPFYPVPGGLLRIGSDDLATSFYWLTKGDPQHWPIVLKSRSDKYEEHAFPLTTFLALAFTKKLDTKIWKKAFVKDREGGRADPKQFRFLTQSIRKRVPGKSVYELYQANGNKVGFWMHLLSDYATSLFLIKSIGGVESGPLAQDFEKQNPKVISDFYINGKIFQKDMEVIGPESMSWEPAEAPSDPNSR